MRFRGSKRKVGARRVKGDGFTAHFGGRGGRCGEGRWAPEARLEIATNFRFNLFYVLHALEHGIPLYRLRNLSRLRKWSVL